MPLTTQVQHAPVLCCQPSDDAIPGIDVDKISSTHCELSVQRGACVRPLAYSRSIRKCAAESGEVSHIFANTDVPFKHILTKQHLVDSDLKVVYDWPSEGILAESQAAIYNVH